MDAEFESGINFTMTSLQSTIGSFSVKKLGKVNLEQNFRENVFLNKSRYVLSYINKLIPLTDDSENHRKF